MSTLPIDGGPSMAGDTNNNSRRRRMARIIVGTVGAFAAVLVVVLATRPSARNSVPASPLIGQPAPPIVGKALDGRHVDLATLRGRWVVVNFFATWCVECREEHPDLVAFSQRHTGPNDPAIVAVAYDQTDVSAARGFFATYGGTWPVVADSGSVAIDYGVRGLPESFVIDPDGVLRQHILGRVTADGLDQIVRSPR